MALLEKEATRFAESLEDYEHVSVTDIGGWGPIGYWLVVHDHRLELDYEIASHCDYWDFIEGTGGTHHRRVSGSLMIHEILFERSRAGSC